MIVCHQSFQTQSHSSSFSNDRKALPFTLLNSVPHQNINQVEGVRFALNPWSLIISRPHSAPPPPPPPTFW